MGVNIKKGDEVLKAGHNPDQSHKLLSAVDEEYLAKIEEAADESGIPWGTMAVNVLGSFGIAVFGTLLFERFVEERERMFWVLGLLGSFTTFSSFALQTSQGWANSPLLGALYGGGSIVLGLLAALLGIRLTRRVLEW